MIMAPSEIVEDLRSLRLIWLESSYNLAILESIWCCMILGIDNIVQKEDYRYLSSVSNCNESAFNKSKQDSRSGEMLITAAK